jgi:RNA-binding protein YhbY
LVKHVRDQLRSRELVKLKLQKSALEKSATVRLAQNIAASTGSTLVDVMGHTFTLYKKREAQRLRESVQFTDGKRCAKTKLIWCSPVVT